MGTLGGKAELRASLIAQNPSRVTPSLARYQHLVGTGGTENCNTTWDATSLLDLVNEIS